MVEAFKDVSRHLSLSRWKRGRCGVEEKVDQDLSSDFERVSSAAMLGTSCE